jgi:glyoxylate carboligase
MAVKNKQATRHSGENERMAKKIKREAKTNVKQEKKDSMDKKKHDKNVARKPSTILKHKGNVVFPALNVCMISTLLLSCIYRLLCF